jgi:purine-binding chemotaxis protein CheW
MDLDQNELDILDERARVLAQGADTSGDRKVAWVGVVVLIGGERCGFPVAIVSRIVKSPKITKLPRTPSHLWGVTALRGEVLSVVDVATLLGARTCAAGGLLLIAEGGTGLVGIPIETLVGFRTVYEDEMSTVVMPGTDVRGFVAARTKDFVSLVDAGKLLAADQMRFASLRTN